MSYLESASRKSIEDQNSIRKAKMKMEAKFMDMMIDLKSTIEDFAEEHPILVSVVGGGTVLFGLVSLLHRLNELKLIRQTGGMPFLHSRVPFFGNIVPIFTNNHRFLLGVHEKFPNSEVVGTVGLGGLVVIMQTPNMVKQAHGRRGATYDSFDVEWPAAFMKILGDNMGIWKGKRHKEAKKSILSYTGPPAQRAYFPEAQRIFKKYMKVWEAQCEHGTKYLEVKSEFRKPVGDFMTDLLLGVDFRETDEYRKVQKILPAIGAGMMSLPIDLGSRNTFGKGIIASRDFHHILLHEAIRRTKLMKESKEMEKEFSERADFLQMNINNSLANGGDGVSDLDYDNILTIIYASLDTTFASASWVAVSFALFPHITARIREETAKHPFDSISSFQQGKEDLPYTFAVVKEVLRFWAISAVNFRQAFEPFTLTTESGTTYTVPKGTFVLTANHIVNKFNPHCKNREEFEPERFLPPRSEPESDPAGIYGYIPFGMGLRKCPGYAIAEMELFILVMLMSQYEWKLKERFEDLVFESQPTVSAIGPLLATMKKIQ